MRSNFAGRCVLALLASAIIGGGAARGEALLQIYIEGAEYDTATETWVLTADSNNSEVVRLWTIGNVSSKGTISDVKLAIAYEAIMDGEFGIDVDYDDNDPPWILPISLAPSTTGGEGGFVDPSESPEPVFIQHRDDGSTPLLEDGSPLPAHGEYGEGIAWQEFYLGDFDQTDSPIADFIDEFPEPSSKLGQINVYEVSLLVDTDVHGVRLHFDLYNHVTSRNRGVFAPFSHTADGTVIYTPAPSAIVGLLTLGATVILLLRRRREGQR